MFDSCPDVIRPNDLMKLLGFGRTKTYQLLRDGTIPSRRIGGSYLIRKDDVIEFLQEKK